MRVIRDIGGRTNGYRWVQRFAPLLADAARFRRHSVGNRWFVDETLVKVRGVGATSTDRSANTTGHRRAGLGPPGRRCGPPVPHRDATDAQGDAERSDRRRLAGRPRRARRPGSLGLASRRAVNQQPEEGDHSQLKRRLRRDSPWLPMPDHRVSGRCGGGVADFPADARPAAWSDGAGDHRRAPPFLQTCDAATTNSDSTPRPQPAVPAALTELAPAI
jgi:hypothetical protein